MELFLPYVLLTGLALFVLGAFLLLVAAFRTRIWWGLGILAFPPVSLFFFAKHSSRSLIPSLLMFLGVLMTAGPNIYAKLRPLDLGPRASVVNGELHVTLTGWDRKDYSFLRDHPRVVVLQMANPDVEDKTLYYLDRMTDLRELDLNNTKVTDAGLSVIHDQFPKLEDLKLSNTAVTDEGLTHSLASMGSLKRLDLRKTKVTADALRAWKDAKPGRRAMP